VPAHWWLSPTWSAFGFANDAGFPAQDQSPLMPRPEKLLLISSSGANKLNVMLEAFLDIPNLLVEVVHYREQHEYFDNSLSGMWQRALNRAAGFTRDVAYNNSILTRADRFAPDFLFVIKGNRVFPSTLARLKQRLPHCQLISWSQDDMFAPHNRTQLYTRSVPLYDLIVTQKSFNLAPAELPSLGARHILFQNKAFLPRVHRRYAANEVDAPTHDVLFIGTAERERFLVMNEAARQGIEIHVYGSNWDTPAILREKSPNLLIHHELLLAERYAAALSRAKISLCFLRKQNRDRQTSRTVEIPACGGFMLAEDTEEQKALFEPDHEAVYFTDAIGLARSIRYYLSNEPVRRAIADAGFLRTRQSDYSYQARALEILETARRHAHHTAASRPTSNPRLTAPEVLSRNRTPSEE
jgi:spore maturation protein CgeB